MSDRTAPRLPLTDMQRVADCRQRLLSHVAKNAGYDDYVRRLAAEAEYLLASLSLDVKELTKSDV